MPEETTIVAPATPATTPVQSFSPPKQTKVSLTPEQPKAPPKEVLNREFSMGDFKPGESAPIQLPEQQLTDDEKETQEAARKLAKRGAELRKQEQEGKKDDKPGEQVQDEKQGTHTKPSTSVEGVLKPPQAKETSKTGEQANQQVKGKSDIVPISPVQPAGRDYTGFSQDEVKVLKQMSNEAFEFASKTIKENKELSKLKDSTYLQHPDAYTLSPDYRQAQNEIQFATVEGNGWRDALLLCRQGKPFKLPQGINTETGQLVWSDQLVQPSDTAELELQRLMTESYSIANQRKGALQQLATNFKNRVQTDTQQIQAEAARRFAWVSDPKLMDHIVEVDGVGPKSLKQIKEDFTSLFPPYLRNNLATDIAAHMMIAMVIQKAQLTAALANQQVAETLQKDQLRAEPTSSVRPGPKPEEIGGVREFSMEGMPS